MCVATGAEGAGPDPVGKLGGGGAQPGGGQQAAPAGPAKPHLGGFGQPSSPLPAWTPCRHGCAGACQKPYSL